MKPRAWLVLLSIVAATFPDWALAGDDAATRKDLTAVIALQGLPCGEVIKVEEKATDDYVATCKDGNRYHVYVVEGRVVAKKV